MRRRSANSNRPIAAAITTAAKRRVGRSAAGRARPPAARGSQRADDARELRARACGLGHRRARRAAADREALEESGRQVGDAEPDHLLVRIDRRSQPRRIVRESTLVSANDTSATARPPISDRHEVVDADHGKRGAGNPCGNGPSTDTPGASRQVEHADQRRRGDHGDQDAGHARPALEQQDREQRARADGESRDVRSCRRARRR